MNWVWYLKCRYRILLQMYCIYFSWVGWGEGVEECMYFKNVPPDDSYECQSLRHTVCKWYSNRAPQRNAIAICLLRKIQQSLCTITTFLVLSGSISLCWCIPIPYHLKLSRYQHFGFDIMVICLLVSCNSALLSKPLRCLPLIYLWTRGII